MTGLSLTGCSVVHQRCDRHRHHQHDDNRHRSVRIGNPEGMAGFGQEVVEEKSRQHSRPRGWKYAAEQGNQ